MNEEFKKKMKSESRDRHLVSGMAMKRGSFAQHDLEGEIVEGESTCTMSDAIAQDPSAGKAILYSCVSVTLKLYSGEPSSAVRALDVRRPITGLCTLLEGEGGGLTFGGSCDFSVDFKFAISACRGEVCIYASPFLTISRINNFIFECCIVITKTCERADAHMQSDMSDMQYHNFDPTQHSPFHRVGAHSLTMFAHAYAFVHSVMCHSSTHDFSQCIQACTCARLEPLRGSSR